MDSLVLTTVPQLEAIIQAAVEKALQAKGSKESDEKLISPAEACKLFDPVISKVTLNKWTKEGLIPMQKIGGRVYYKHSDVIDAGSKLKRYTATRNNFNR